MPELRLKEYSALVENGLNGLFPQEECRHSKIFEACRYSLLAGGKHIRAALLLEFYRLCGGRVEDCQLSFTGSCAACTKLKESGETA